MLNVIHHRAAHTTELRIRAKTQPLFLPPPMPPLPDMELLSREDRIVLAVDLLKSDASLSVHSVAARLCIPESTLRSRRARTPARRDIYSGDRNRFPVLTRRLLSTRSDTRRSLPHIY
jgi:hypothetical protein